MKEKRLMGQHNILITGGYGCIGSEAAKWLLRNSNAELVLCSRRVSAERTERVFHDVDRDRLTIVQADVTEQQAMLSLLNEHQITAVAHMAALQTPDCNSNRDQGLQINLAGTQNLIEAIKQSKHQLQRFVFASSIAVYGPRAEYPSGKVPMLAPPKPVNVYGIWKLAAEHLARLFYQDTGIPTVCLRPGVLFGPGRDAGLTASPTTAMKCLALGVPFRIPFCSRQDYLFAPDVGAAVGNTLTEPFNDFGIYTLPSHTLETRQIANWLKQIADQLDSITNFQITVGDEQVPFICDLEFEPFLQAFPACPLTKPLEALLQSMNVFVDQVKKGWLKEEDLPV